MVAEGASVVGLAAVLSGKITLAGGPAATIVTGRNLDMGLFTRVVSGEPLTLGDTRLEARPYAP
jgi:Threonine dehydratase